MLAATNVEGLHKYEPTPANRANRGKLKGPRDFRRGHVQVIIMQILLRIKYLFQTWFFLKPILHPDLGAYPSFLRPKNIPKVSVNTLISHPFQYVVFPSKLQPSYLTMMTLRMFWFFGAFTRSNKLGKLILFILIKLRVMHLLNKIYLGILEGIGKQMEESGIDWEKARAIPIPTYDWENGSPEEFYNTYVKRPHPVILKNFLKGTKIMEEYTFDKMVEKFGDETVLLTTPEKDGVLGKLREVNNPKVYLHNSEVLLKKYPEIIDSFEKHRLEPYVRKTNEFSQFFIGRQGTGTPFHNASNSNLFLMIDGSKRWYFIDPYDSYLANPFYLWGGAAATILALYPDDYHEHVMPAFKYCPYYYGDLEPGDVLHNPPWWLHGIRNTADKTCGVATRWLTGGLVGSNLVSMEEDYDIHRWASFNFMTGPNSILFMHETLRESTPSYDEFSTVRERDTRSSHHQVALAKGTINIDGWRPLF